MVISSLVVFESTHDPEEKRAVFRRASAARQCGTWRDDHALAVKETSDPARRRFRPSLAARFASNWRSLETNRSMR
jgi:hypothetical protein